VERRNLEGLLVRFLPGESDLANPLVFYMYDDRGAMLVAPNAAR
jgi:hypothetical protein